MEIDLSRAVDALPGLVWTAGLDGGSDFLNQRWCDYTGLSFAAALGDGWLEAVHPDDLDALMTRWKAILASREPGEAEARLRRFDGVYRWFRFNASPITDAAGEIVKWCGINTDIDDSRRAELAALAKEQRFHAIVEGLPTIVILMRPDGQFDHANQHLLDYVGVPLEDLKAAAYDFNWRFRFHPDDRAEILSRWMHSIETGDHYRYEGRLRRHDGVYRCVDITGIPLLDDRGEIVLWYVLQMDIDDRKRAEAMLVGEKRMLELVAAGRSISTILGGLCELVESAITASYASVVLLDPTGERLEHGVAPSLPAGYIQTIMGWPTGVEANPCAMAAVLGEQVISTDIAAETRWSGHAWPALALGHGLGACWSTPILSASGKVLGAFAIFHDEPRAPSAEHQQVISQLGHIASIAIDRAQADAALRRSEAFLAETRRLSATGGFSESVSTKTIQWSDEVFRMFELDGDQPVTLERILSRVHPEDVGSFEEMFDAQERELDYRHDYRLLMPDGRVKYLQVTASARRGVDGGLEYIAAVQDVTARRVAEDALTQARADLAHVARVSSLGAVTASIAHEVNQPLAGIITNAGAMLRMLAVDPPNVAGAEATARRIIRDGGRAAEVVARLRALFSRQKTVTEAIDLNEIVREVLALAAGELRRSGLSLKLELTEELPLLDGDRVQLQQVILNLLLNAAEAMSEVEGRPRQAVISTLFDGASKVRFSVRDSGVGFDAATAEQLFQAFFTTKPDGMGIGLSVSRSIIERHDGRLWATANEDAGATFHFSIPIAQDNLAPELGMAAANEGAGQ